jgi:hypothetical protein
MIGFFINLLAVGTDLSGNYFGNLLQSAAAQPRCPTPRPGDAVAGRNRSTGRRQEEAEAIVMQQTEILR